MSLNDLLIRDHGSALERFRELSERHRQTKRGVEEYRQGVAEGAVMPRDAYSRYLNEAEELGRIRLAAKEQSHQLQSALLDGLRSGDYTATGRIGSWSAERSAIDRDQWWAVRVIDFTASSAGAAIDDSGRPLGFWIYGIEVEAVTAVGAASLAKPDPGARPGPSARSGDIAEAIESLRASGPLPALKKSRNALISQWLKDHGRDGVSDRTIRRHFNKQASEDDDERSDRDAI